MMSKRQTSANNGKAKVGSRERRSPIIKRTKTPSSNELKNKYKFSPKGKRKLDFPKGKKVPGPLTGMLFYLHLPGSPRQADQLKKTIVQLGGTIEEFFRKEVTYLVTNDQFARSGKSPSSQSAASPGTPSPLPLTRSSSMKNYGAVSPMSTDSPQGMDMLQNQTSKTTTRGKSIAYRSTGFRKGTSDVMSNASTWGVTVCHVDLVLKWISQVVKKANQQPSTAKEKTKSPSECVSQMKVPRVVALQDTYIKVEDLNFKYRPLIHEFKVWPEISFDCLNVCPFDPPRRKSSENSIAKRKRDKGTMIAIHERSKSGYCECCKARYADLDTHLRGRQHKEFAKKDSNYVSLDKAINAGFKVEDLFKEVYFKKSITFSVAEKSDIPVRCDESYDSCSDKVFLLSTPSNKEKLCDKKEPMKRASVVKNESEDSGSSLKSCSPNNGAKITASESRLLAKEVRSPPSGPVTRLKKACSNLSLPCERKPSSSVSARDNCNKIAEHKSHSKTNKRKSTEVTDEQNSQSDNLRDDGNTSESVSNDHDAPKRTRQTISKISITTNIEHHDSEAKVKGPQGNNNMIKCENILLRSKTNREQVCAENSVDQSDKASLSASEEQTMVYALVETKKENCGFTRPKRKSNGCSETGGIQKLPSDNIDVSVVGNLDDEKEKNKKSGEGKSHVELKQEAVINGTVTPYEDEDSQEIRSLKRRNRKPKKLTKDISDAEENSNDSPRLKTPSKKISNDVLAICPGALVEEEHRGTVRSTRRIQSLLGDCKLSPISQCKLDEDYSARSSCAEESDILPSGLRIYSSLGSSMDNVSKDVDWLVDSIEEKCGTDDDTGNENQIHIEPDSFSGCGEIVEDHISKVYEGKNALQDKTKIENTELQVSLTYLNVDTISAALWKNGDSNFERKRKVCDKEESTKARKCQRFSEQDASDSAQAHPVMESDFNINIFENEVPDQYRCSVAERVKLNRANLESTLQECSSPTAKRKEPEYPQVQTTRQSKATLLCSPFAEITNTRRKIRQRAKSEGKIRTTARSFARRNPKELYRPAPRSACLTTNDPFRFDDFQ